MAKKQLKPVENTSDSTTNKPTVTRKTSTRRRGTKTTPTKDKVEEELKKSITNIEELPENLDDLGKKIESVKPKPLVKRDTSKEIADIESSSLLEENKMLKQKLEQIQQQQTFTVGGNRVMTDIYQRDVDDVLLNKVKEVYTRMVNTKMTPQFRNMHNDAKMVLNRIVEDMETTFKRYLKKNG